MYELHMHKFDEDSLSNDDGVRFDDNKSENDSDVGCEDGAEEQHGSLHEEKRISYLTGDEIKGLHWESEDSVFQFYTRYARCHGFVVRKDDVFQDLNDNVIKHQFVCN